MSDHDQREHADTLTMLVERFTVEGVAHREHLIRPGIGQEALLRLRELAEEADANRDACAAALRATPGRCETCKHAVIEGGDAMACERPGFSVAFVPDDEQPYLPHDFGCTLYEPK